MKNFILGALVLLFFYTTTVKADHIPNMPPLDEEYHWQQMPVICSTAEVMVEKIKRRNMIPVEISLGKRNAMPDGEIVFAVMFFVGQNNERAALMSVPNTDETCLIYITFDARSANPGS